MRRRASSSSYGSSRHGKGGLGRERAPHSCLHCHHGGRLALRSQPRRPCLRHLVKPSRILPASRPSACDRTVQRVTGHRSVGRRRGLCKRNGGCGRRRASRRPIEGERMGFCGLAIVALSRMSSIAKRFMVGFEDWWEFEESVCSSHSSQSQRHRLLEF